MSAEPPHRIRLALLFGGRSPEHDVSVTSARSVQEALDPTRFEVLPMAIGRDGRWLGPAQARAKLVAGEASDLLAGEPPMGQDLVPATTLTGAVDVVFPLLHGPYGEDGTIQGLLELLNVPYVGAGVAGSAAGMDKSMMKALFRECDLPVLPFTLVKAYRWRSDRESVLTHLLHTQTFPCFVKPANMGSSVGVSRVDDVQHLASALDLAFTYDTKVLVERGVPGYREIECAVLGNDDPAVSVPGEILLRSAFYDYDTKYTAGAAGFQVPAGVSTATRERLQALALAAFMAIDAAGMARVDFLVSPDESEIWLSEINTIPGFTPYSMFPMLWQASGLAYPELIARLVALALERHEERRALQHERLPDQQDSRT